MSLSQNNYSVLSLFSGGGGLDLGFEAEGFQLLEAIDINPWCVETLKKNRPNWQVILGDVRDYYPEHKPDVLLAGVPCQGFSLGGHREANDSRNMLYKEVIRVAKICQPKIVLIENVLNLRTMKSPETNRPFTEQIIRELEDIGYQVFPDIFKVCHYGVPQTRRRFVFIAFRDKAPPGYCLPPPGKSTTIREFLYDLAQGKVTDLPNHNPQWGFKSKVHRETGEAFDLREEVVPVRLSRTASDGHPIRSFDAPFPAIDTATIWGWAQGNVVANRYAKDASLTSKASKGGKRLWRVSASRIRSFSDREYARLQTFPDDWIFMGQTKRDIHLQIGNAVPVRFAKVLAYNIKKALECLDKRQRFTEQLEQGSDFWQLSLF